MRILLVSSSARGHAIADALKRSPQNPDLISIATTANPGIKELAEEQFIESNLTKIDRILEIAKRTKPDLAVIGPEDPIAAGIADMLEEHNIPTVAPQKNLARIESSKGFARELLKKHGIDASPKYRIFSHPLSLHLRQGFGGQVTLSPRERGQRYSLPHGGTGPKERGYKNEIHRFIEDELHGNYVVKYDSLKGGKGVKVSGEHLQTVREGVEYAEKCIDECGQVVIEEKLVGCEFSLISFVDGKHVIDCPLVQDHKRAYDGDTGPNTGGMGTYSDSNHSLPFLNMKEVERAKEIQRLTVEALQREYRFHPPPLSSPPSGGGAPPGEGSYKGILYGGYMATRNGIKLIEFNCRFGDPEALNILSIVESDFVAICQAITTWELKDDMVRFAKKATVCKYVVPKSYPEGKEEVGEEVMIPKNLKNARIYYGDVSLCHGERVMVSVVEPRTMAHVSSLDYARDDTFLLGRSRAIGIVGIAQTIPEAEHIAQKLCEQVKGPVRFRSDIGTPHLIQQRVDLMNRLRS